MAAIDYSKYGAVAEPDYSKYGAVPETQMMAQPGQQMPQAQPAQNAQQAPQQSFIDKLANSPFINSILGAGDALASTLSAGLVNPHTGSGTAYDVGKFAGDIGGFVGGGEALDTARFASEALPMAGKYAQMLGQEGMGATRRILGSGIYGADTNPDDRVKGFLKGGAIGSAAEAVPGAFDLGAKVISNIQPKKYAQQLMDMLSGGQSQEESAQSLASTLKNSYEQQAQKGNELYSNIFDRVGGSSVYDGVTEPGQYSSVGKDITDHYDYKLKNLHQDFSSDPTLQNAHNLQSQLGFGIRKLQAKDAKSGLDVADRSALQAYHEAQGAVQGDISTFLNSQDESLAKGYEAANKNWLENVVPYKENAKISQMAKGDITNPRNLSNIFASPEPEIQKVVEDMGPEAQRRILYAELGKTQNKFTPEKLLDSFNSLENKGLNSYVNPSLQQQFEILSGRLRNRDATQKLAGGLLGGAVLGHGPLSTTIGALGGGSVTPAIMRYLQSRLPIDQISGAISKAAPALYRPASTAIMANAIPGRPQ